MNLSLNARAVLILLDAQSHVYDRGDGAWWALDAVKWELIATLDGAEHAFILALILHQCERRESARVARRGAVAA